MSATDQAQQRPPFWRDVRVLRVVGQVAFVALVFALYWFLATNFVTNMSRSNLPTGFGYLNQPGGFQVANTDVTSGTPIRRIILVGVINTLKVSSLGIVLATVIGVLVGIARLSSNWLIRKSAAVYVESLRNIPVLVIIIFFGAAVLLRLPQIQAPIESPGRFIISNQAFWLPWMILPEGGGNTLLLILAVGLLTAGAVAWWRTRVYERTGSPHHRVLWGLSAFAAVAAVGYALAGPAVEFSGPARDGFRVSGGIKLPVPFLAVLAGLSLYTASHIAEIVRGSILAVPRGQVEAAEALALTRFQRMRHVVLPQALRIMVPPTANQYLNLTKNSSLAIAAGFPEVTTVILVVIGNGRPAPQNIAILMGVYLVFSLVISALTNLYNRRIQFVAN